MMKNIKEYINESLFDSEDDIMDKKLSSESIEWFDKHVKFIKRGLGAYSASELLSINDEGETICKYPTACVHIEYYEQPPKWIKFDKRSWEHSFSWVCYDVTSQKDIESIPGGRNGHITNFINKKTQNIIVSDWCDFESKSLKNITVDKGCQIGVITDNINQLAEIKFSKYSSLNYLELREYELVEELFKEYKRLKTKGFVKKYRDILTKMHNNGVFAFVLNYKKTFILEDIL